MLNLKFMIQEELQLNQEKTQTTLDKMKSIFNNKKLRTFEKFARLESDLIETPSPKLKDLFTIIKWAEERKPRNLNWQENLDKTESKALMTLLQIIEQSPDPKKWSAEIKNISKTEGQQIIDLIEKRMILIGNQIRQEKEDYKKKELSQELNKLDRLHTKLEFFIKNLP